MTMKNSEIKSDLKNLNEKAHETTNAFSDAAHHLKEKAYDARDKIYDAAGNVRERAEEFAHDIKDKAVDAHEDVVQYVRKNPIKSIGFAVIAGMLLSKLFDK